MNVYNTTSMYKAHCSHALCYLWLNSSSCSRCDRSSLSRLGAQSFHQQERDHVGGLGAADVLATHWTLGTAWFARPTAVLAGDEGFHEACMAKQVAWA